MITITSPTGDKIIYGLRPGSYQIPRSTTITWTGSVGNCTVRYSTNNGSSWTNIATAVPSGTCTWDINTVPSGLSITHLVNIIGALHEGNALIQVVDSEGTTASVTVTIREISLGSIVPSDESIIYFNDDCVNIDWDYLWPDGLTGVKVSVYYANTNDTGRVTSLTGFSVATNTSWDSWAPDRSFPLQLFSSGIVGYDRVAVQVVIKVEDIRNSTEGNWITSEYRINFTPNRDNVTYANGLPEDMTRFIIGYPTAVDKAMFPDEAVPLGQIEAGKGIIIRTRNASGVLPSETIAGKTLSGDIPDSAIDPSVIAHNIVFELDPEVPHKVPRAIEGIVDMKDTNVASPVASPAWNTTNGYYGQMMSTVVSHNFDHKVKISTVQVANTDGAEYAGACDASCYYEVINSNSIRLYCVVKNATYPATLNKDKLPVVDFDPTYIFKYRIEEFFTNDDWSN